MKIKRDLGVMLLHVKELKIGNKPPKISKGHRTDPSAVSEGTSPVDTLISDFQPSQLWGNPLLLSKPPVHGASLRQLQEPDAVV